MLKYKGKTKSKILKCFYYDNVYYFDRPTMWHYTEVTRSAQKSSASTGSQTPASVISFYSRGPKEDTYSRLKQLTVSLCGLVVRFRHLCVIFSLRQSLPQDTAAWLPACLPVLCGLLSSCPRLSALRTVRCFYAVRKVFSRSVCTQESISTAKYAQLTADWTAKHASL